MFDQMHSAYSQMRPGDRMKFELHKGEPEMEPLPQYQLPGTPAPGVVDAQPLQRTMDPSMGAGMAGAGGLIPGASVDAGVAGGEDPNRRAALMAALSGMVANRGV